MSKLQDRRQVQVSYEVRRTGCPEFEKPLGFGP